MTIRSILFITLFVFGCAKKNAPVVTPTPTPIETSEEDQCSFAYDYLCADQKGLWLHIADYSESDEIAPLEAVTIDHPLHGAIPMKPHPTNIAWWTTEQMDHRTSFDDFEFGLEVQVVYKGERCDALETRRFGGVEFTDAVLLAETCNIPAKNSACSPMCEMEGCEIAPVDYDNPYCKPIPERCDVGLMCPAYGLCEWSDDEQDQSGGGCYATKASCEASFICRHSGRCLEDGRCVAATHEACRESIICQTEGRCGFSPMDDCAPRTEEDCRQSEQCKTLGRCRLGYAVFGADSKESSSYDRLSCVVACDDDCAASDACRTDGLCWVNEGDDRYCGKEKEGNVGAKPYCKAPDLPSLYKRELILVAPYFFANDSCSSEVEWKFDDTDPLVACYRELLKRKPNVQGQARYTASYDPEGEPLKTDLVFEPKFGGKAFRECVSLSLEQMKGEYFEDCELDVPIHFYLGH